ncbi:MAG TPA: TlyA family RNA methyltransferase [Ilumatobacteraceae bacterium]|nr:TlyA family RNA methyltransferase [Ilumatobacteraceae bacterium]HRB04459.1 TlyA family RNA methyltransferase [Ilumatobacteraceae bacterium]
MARRQRLDAELVRRQLAESRTDAARSITAGRVLVNGTFADKASRQVHTGDAIVIAGPPARFVSRGGEKLDAALAAFEIDVGNLRALDAGASTGGFTDCLLQRGAAHVVALDVGHGQLHPRIRDDQRVTVLERFHIRDATPAAIGGAVQLVVADLSFISLRRVLAPLIGAALPGSALVLLVKPQFEAGRVEVAKAHGVITDTAIHERVRDEVGAALIEADCAVQGWVDSPIYGGDGNREFLVHAITNQSGSSA